MTTSRNKEGLDFSRLVDIDVLLLSPSHLSPYNNFWPMGLTSNFLESTVDLNNIESFGSIWRMQIRIDSFPGTRIIIQSSVRIICLLSTLNLPYLH